MTSSSLLSLRAASLFIACLIAAPVFGQRQAIEARCKQGSVHGVLSLKSTDGRVIAVGDQIEIAHGDLVRSRLLFRFRDGSIDDETTVMRQGSTLQLISDHHVQKGPSFPKPLDISVKTSSGEVTWKVEKDGKEEIKTEHLDLPPDLVNGFVSLAVENFPQRASEMKVSYLSLDSKPRIVTLSIKQDGEQDFEIAETHRKAKRFNIHIELGGVAAVVAPAIGKQPTDIKIYTMDGEVATFLKMEGALYLQGPTWIMVPTAPVWPDSGY